MNKKQVSLSASSKELELLQQMSTEENSSKELLKSFARIVWSRLIEPGDKTAVKLISFFGAKKSLEMVLNNNLSTFEETSKRELQIAYERWKPRINRGQSIKDIHKAVREKIKILTPENGHWPNSLQDLDIHKPIILWFKGNHELLTTDSISLVGARASTSYGEQITNEFAYTSTQIGLTVISGAAYGIDAVAHRSVLANEGNTIAVVAGGVDRIYPAGNADLLSEIALRGLVCSEMVPGSAPTRWRFLQRNRNIACLTKATIVTEAGARSGSLNTAGNAAQLGRKLGAVPGPITSVTSMGTHKLIREYGAELIASVEDLKELLGVNSFDSLTSTKKEHQIYKRIIDALPLTGYKTEFEVAREAGLSSAQTRKVLGELELIGTVNRAGSLGPDTKWKLVC